MSFNTNDSKECIIIWGPKLTRDIQVIVIGQEAKMVQVHFTLGFQDWKVQSDLNKWLIYLVSYMAIGG